MRTLFWALVGLGLAFAVLMIRLDTGPIELAWLKPRIERALRPENGVAAVTAERIELRLDKEQRTFGLVGIDVRYQAAGEDGTPLAPFLVFPEVELALSVEALLKRGMIAASDVRAEAPSLIVKRSQDGVVGLYSEAGYAGQGEDIDFGKFLRRFALAPDGDDRLAYLKKLQIVGGRVAFYDQSRASALTAENADMTLTRREGGADAWLRADLPQRSMDPVSVQLSGRIEPDADHVAFEADVADLMPADLPSMWPRETLEMPVELKGMRLPIRASIAGEIGLDGGLSPLVVEIEAATGTVDLPAHLAEPLEIDKAELNGTIAEDFGAIAVDRAVIVSRGATLRGSGRAVWRKDEPTLLLDLESRNVRAEDLPAFWPPDLGIDAREWVVENIRTGRVSTGKAKIDLQPGDFGPGPVRDEAVDGIFAFEGLSARYIEEMPPLENAFGNAVFDADHMEFDVKGGTNAGVTLTGGSVTITGMGKPGKLATQLHVLAAVEAPVEQTLALLSYPPLEIAEELEIAPAETAGHVTTRVDVRMPLHDEVTGEEAVVLAEAELVDLAIERLPKLGGDVRLDQGVFSLVVDEDTVRLDGKAEVNGIPLAINVIEPLDEEASTRRIDLAGSLSRDQLESEDIRIDGLDGGVGFEATVTETDSHFWIDLTADLASLALAPPGLAWEKPAGQEGVLYASIAKPVDGPLEVRQFDVTTGDLEVSGALSLSPSNQGLQSLVLDRFRLADTDAVIRYGPDGKGGYDIIVEAARLDLDALFGDDRNADDTLKAFHAILRADQLRARGIELVNVEADAVHSAEGWRTASVIGTLPSGGNVVLELTPDGADRRLEVRAENAGALIEAFDLGQRIEGGNLTLSARLQAQDPVTASGRFEITKFVLQDAPLLARMLTLASLTGIGNLLGGEGIEVDHLILPFVLDDRKLTLADGLLRGSQIGLTIKGDVGLKNEIIDLAGTIIPVYTLNRLIGRVPIIGRILTGADGRGAFAATYSIEGAKDSPTVYVNPLSILAPGMIRDFLGGLIDGTGEPPTFRNTDD